MLLTHDGDGSKIVNIKYLTILFTRILILSCLVRSQDKLIDTDLEYPVYKPLSTDRIISRKNYVDQLQGFWLGQCIANWTGLITEMDKIEHPFYTDADWKGPDQPNIWGNYVPSSNNIIDYYFIDKGDVWSADDDTDIEYMYQYLLDYHNVSILSPDQIREGWLNHIYSNESAPNNENFLWVSNESAYYLMKEGLVPPFTSEPENNSHYTMIDAQLTTEIFGLFSPARPDIALQMAHLPIRTTAKYDAEWISEFYVTMHSLASAVPDSLLIEKKLVWLAKEARKRLPDSAYSAKMYDFIYASYTTNLDKNDWEKTRDQVYQRYQKNSTDGYSYQQPFDAGINFAASLISLFYGAGNIPRTIQIGTLAGWDSDNPTATWGGLLGFLLGKEGIKKVFNKSNFSDAYWIHRTRRNFPDHTPGMEGEDTFQLMARRGIYIIDRVVLEEMKGGVDLNKDVWYIPIIKN
tara:strand:+ start:5132 stop:6520 length:1389 start_codon:yes stop_codon:yes gene_type:complete